MKIIKITLIIFLSIILWSNVYAGSITRDLKKMVGYTIIMSDTVEKVFEQNGDKFIELNNGYIFKVKFLLFSPFIYTDVIVFGKGSLFLKEFIYLHKLLIDNEVYDAMMQ